MIEELAKITASSEPMTQAHLLWLRAPQIAQQARPGQFVMARCEKEGEFQLRRPLSIHQREGDRVALLLSVVGRGTQWLAQRKPGEKISLLGPLGNGFNIHSDSKKLLMIAGGLGIAPLRFLADEAVRQGLSVTLLYGAPTARQLYPTHLLPTTVKLVTATEDGTAGKKGMITSVISEHIDQTDQVFACGPPPMYRAMAKMPELKAKPVQISLEVRMGCGVGICYGCTVKTKRGLKQVCKDGPVFELNDIMWEWLADI